MPTSHQHFVNTSALFYQTIKLFQQPFADLKTFSMIMFLLRNTFTKNKHWNNRINQCSNTNSQCFDANI
eukprot:UN05896